MPGPITGAMALDRGPGDVEEAGAFDVDPRSGRLVVEPLEGDDRDRMAGLAGRRHRGLRERSDHRGTRRRRDLRGRREHDGARGFRDLVERSARDGKG